MEKHKIADYKVLKEDKGIRYRFFCQASGMAMMTSKRYLGTDPEQELEIAWNNEGRGHFNLCHKCGRWVCDAMYNADVLHCVDCTPWEDKPKYCTQCGTRVDITDVFCRKCGVKLQYREETADDN